MDKNEVNWRATHYRRSVIRHRRADLKETDDLFKPFKLRSEPGVSLNRRYITTPGDIAERVHNRRALRANASDAISADATHKGTVRDTNSIADCVAAMLSNATSITDEDIAESYAAISESEDARALYKATSSAACRAEITPLAVIEAAKAMPPVAINMKAKPHPKGNDWGRW